MGNRSRAYEQQNESRTPEELEKEKERIRKLQQTRRETESTMDGRFKVSTKDGRDQGVDPLLEMLIKEHPEKDPANVK